MYDVAVIGLGYVGLPLAVQAAQKGLKVIGIDYNKELVTKVNIRESPYVNDERFAKALQKVSPQNLVATTSYDDLAHSDIIIICVPTPTENNIPDLSIVLHATKQVASKLHEGQLIIIESTVSPGVTRDEVLHILESESGLKVGSDFYLAHCPERIDPGNDKFFVGNLNRVVGGITEDCTQKAVTFYIKIIDAQIIPLSSTEEAEFVKSWENSHRNVMIALANSAAMICDAVGMDINNVLNGLQSKIDQFGLQLAKPGLGPGGHCIPEDIHYVIKKARQNNVDTNFLDSAVKLNDNMPRYAVHKLNKLVSSTGHNLSDQKIALLGIAYKENVGDFRRSPAVEAGYYLARYAHRVIAHDPFIDTNKVQPIKSITYAQSLDEALSSVDGIFIGTAHQEYRDHVTLEVLQKHNIKFVLDGRNMFNPKQFHATEIKYSGIGQ
jgi:UDP-N-acetyl-D-glucosamine dehydrogenase